MSQMVTRKSVEEKDLKRTGSPVKEMKKKIAANAEKEKQAAEKNPDKPAEKTEKPAEKHTEKPADKKAEKHVDKSSDKKVEKNGEKSDKKTENKQSEKKDGHVEKKDAQTEKKDSHTEKKDTNAEKKEDNKGEKSGKSDTEPKQCRPKQNGSRAHNGVSDVTLSANGCERDVTENGTVSDEDDVMLVIDYEHEQDELFPELTYDDTSDVEGFEPPTAESAPSRSFTRRSQVKVARTPETPRPASDKQTDKEASTDDPKDSKVLKLKDDATNTDRKLRSADSPKKETKIPDSPKKDKDGERGDADKMENGALEVDVIIEIDDDEPRKTDTNYSKSRVKVSPYRRSTRIADQTTSSVMANYTGNNTTMEMDITETSSFGEEPSLDDSSYLNGLRNIRGRRSYKQLKEMTLRHVTANRSARAAANVSDSARPTGTVVGRKRKPDADESVELATDAGETLGGAHTKRMRLLERIAHPFRRTLASTPLPARRAAEIVGINTDLPQSAPVGSPDTFDPESLKPAEAPPVAPLVPAPELLADRDPKRCVVM